MLMQPVADRLEAVRHDRSGGRSRAGARLGRQAERFRMGPAVVLGQDLAEVAGPVRDGTVADLAAGDRKLGNGRGEAAGDLLICLHDAGPAGVILP
jgi:hypothetical protein